MTVIDIVKRRDMVDIVADGHANAPRNEDGRDLVCCAISTLMCAAANSLARVEGPRVMYHTLPETGHAELMVKGVDNAPGEVWPRVQMLIDGLDVLSTQYPQSIRMTIEN